MGFNQEQFNNFILEHNIIGFYNSPRILASGKENYWYTGWDKIIQDPFLMEKVIDFILHFVKDHHLTPDTFYGVPEGATTLGLLTQFAWAKSSQRYEAGSHVLAMGRRQAKLHGNDEDYFVGIPKGKTIILEDVTTTGESLIRKGIEYIKQHAPQHPSPQL